MLLYETLFVYYLFVELIQAISSQFVQIILDQFSHVENCVLSMHIE